jgi:ribosome biogenesis GTPase / thiamine phosphate phosphatase
MISKFYEAQIAPPSVCGRIITQDRNSYLVAVNQHEEMRAQITGALRFQTTPDELPVVGDYVSMRIQDHSALIERVLPRKNLFARRGVDGSHLLQPIASNLDTLFVTMAVNSDFNLRRVERYVTAARAFDIPAVLLLTKIDLIDDVQSLLDSAKKNFPDVQVLTISAEQNIGLEQLRSFRGPESTLAFVGSSGVGKSTLINYLCESTNLAVGEIRKDDGRGKHTTTRRMMIHLNDGTSIIDTPGMREFALADAEDGLTAVFSDIQTVALNCRFRDCKHIDEPDCAVREHIDETRLNSWHKLKREAAFEARKTDRTAAIAEKDKWKAIHKQNRNRGRERNW